MKFKTAVAVMFALSAAICGVPKMSPTFGSTALIASAADDSEIEESGKCGDNISYVLKSNGELVISGSGEWYADFTFSGDDRIRFVSFKEGITSIPPSLFAGCTSITSVSIPNSVTVIGDQAFYYCAFLDSLTIPKSVKSIGSNAFSNCASMKSLTIVEGGNAAIGDHAFCNCTSLTEVELPESVSSIGDGAFQKCSKLASLSIPESVTYIGNSAFDSTSLETVTIPGSVKNIGNKAFYNCSRLWNLTIGGGVESIGTSAFESCYSLKLINFSDSVKSIGDSAFRGCSSLTSVTIPSNVKTIGGDAFCGCGSLKSAIIQNGVESIGKDAFNSCKLLTSVSIPKSVTYIGGRAFEGTVWLDAKRAVAPFVIVNNILIDAINAADEEIVIPDGVTRICGYVFSNHGDPVTVTIPKSVKYIDDGAFFGCNSVTIENPDCIIYGCETSSVTIKGYADSTAHDLCTKNSLSFISIGYYPVKLMGDVNGDSEFDVADLVMVQRWLLSADDSGFVEWRAANFCKDTSLDSLDLALMRRQLLVKTEIGYEGYEVTVVNAETGELITDTSLKIHIDSDNGFQSSYRSPLYDLSWANPIRIDDGVNDGAERYWIRIYDQKMRSNDDTRDYSIVKQEVSPSGRKITVYVSEEKLGAWKTSLSVENGYTYQNSDTYEIRCEYGGILFDLENHKKGNIKIGDYSVNTVSGIGNGRDLSGDIPSEDRRSDLSAEYEELINDVLSQAAELEKCETVTKKEGFKQSSSAVKIYYTDENGEAKSLLLYVSRNGDKEWIDNEAVNKLVSRFIKDGIIYDMNY